MKSMRKMIMTAVAVLTVAAMLLMTGCSTPAVAATINGVDYTTGEYLANLYYNFNIAYYESGLYQYASYGMDPWEQTLPYGEGDDAVEMALSDYIIQQSKDSMVRQEAVNNLMKKYSITVDEEELKEFHTQMESVNESEMIAYGFSKEHYMMMYEAVQLEESALFYGLYDEGGEYAMPEEEIREYFDNNFVAFKAITMAHTDAEGAELSDTDIETNKTILEGYLAEFKESGDMDAIIEKHNATETETTESVTEETAEEATEETAEEETAEEATEEQAAEEATEEEAAGETAEENPNIQIMDTTTGDKNIVETVLKIKEGEASVVEYTDSNGATYTALINRVNVETAGGENYYEDQRATVIYGARFDEFDESVKAEVETIVFEFNERAVKMCLPKSFEEVAAAAAQ